MNRANIHPAQMPRIIGQLTAKANDLALPDAVRIDALCDLITLHEHDRSSRNDYVQLIKEITAKSLAN